jgi:hypothetical protein
MTALLMLRSAAKDNLRPRDKGISGLNHTPHATAVYASRPPSLSDSRNTRLQAARYALPGLDFHQLIAPAFLALPLPTLTSTRPDIVVMDEIIGVGDAAFIKSAQQRLEIFMAEVGIVVVASHSLQVLKTMCHRGAVLHHGAMHFIGPIDDAIESYAELSRSL